MTSRHAFASIGLAVLVSASRAAPARANVVGPPPDVCPNGATGSSCHGGAFCAPATCNAPIDCANGTVCEERPLCMGTIPCGGLIPPDADPSMFASPAVKGLCPNGNECTAGATCTMVKVCASPTASTSSGSSSGGVDANGCSCRVPGVSESGPARAVLALAAIAAGVMLVRRRGPR